MENAVTDVILNNRKTTHGPFENVAALHQATLSVWRTGLNWNRLTPLQKTAIEEISHKVARALSGDPHTLEHYTDICGYATLIINEIKRGGD